MFLFQVCSTPQVQFLVSLLWISTQLVSKMIDWSFCLYRCCTLYMQLCTVWSRWNKWVFQLLLSALALVCVQGAPETGDLCVQGAPETGDLCVQGPLGQVVCMYLVPQRQLISIMLCVQGLMKQVISIDLCVHGPQRQPVYLYMVLPRQIISVYMVLQRQVISVYRVPWDSDLCVQDPQATSDRCVQGPPETDDHCVQGPPEMDDLCVQGPQRHVILYTCDLCVQGPQGQVISVYRVPRDRWCLCTGSPETGDVCVQGPPETGNLCIHGPLRQVISVYRVPQRQVFSVYRVLQRQVISVYRVSVYRVPQHNWSLSGLSMTWISAVSQEVCVFWCDEYHLKCCIF